MTDSVQLSRIWSSNGDSTNPGDANYDIGWLAEIPTFQEMNHVLGALDTNMLNQAERGHSSWDAEVAYVAGAIVHHTGTLWTATADQAIGVAPVLGGTGWSQGGFFGSTPANFTIDYGLYIEASNAASATTWNKNDVTIKGALPKIFFWGNNAVQKNWALANAAGEMVLFDAGVKTNPDGEALTPGVTSRLFHEDHPPTQGEVSGTIPDAPANGSPYIRRNNNWEVITIGDQFLPITGGNLTGNLSVTNPDPTITLYEDDVTDNNLQMYSSGGFGSFKMVNDNGSHQVTLQSMSSTKIDQFAGGVKKSILDTLGLRILAGGDLLIDDAPTLANHATRKDYVDGFNTGLSSGGYFLMPGGMILQWGREDINAAGGEFVTYPIAFPTRVYHIGGTFADNAASSRSIRTADSTLTQFLMQHSDAGTREISWFAIGF